VLFWRSFSLPTINYVFLCPRLCVRCWLFFVLWTARSNYCYRWPFGLKRTSAAARLLIMRVRIPSGAWSVVCCQVHFCAMGRSPVQSSPTECGVCWVWSGATVILCTYSEWVHRGQTVISIQLELLQADIAAVNIRLTGEFATLVPIQIIIL